MHNRGYSQRPARDLSSKYMMNCVMNTKFIHSTLSVFYYLALSLLTTLGSSFHTLSPFSSFALLRKFRFPHLAILSIALHSANELSTIFPFLVGIMITFFCLFDPSVILWGISACYSVHNHILHDCQLILVYYEHTSSSSFTSSTSSSYCISCR